MLRSDRRARGQLSLALVPPQIGKLVAHLLQPGFAFGQAPTRVGLLDERHIVSWTGSLRQGDASLVFRLRVHGSSRLPLSIKRCLSFAGYRRHVAVYRPTLTLLHFFHATGLNSARICRLAKNPTRVLLKIG